MSNHIQTVEKLQPEHIRAICHIDEQMDTMPLCDASKISTDIWKTDSIMKFLDPPLVSQIPSGNDWRWNQTKSRKVALIVKRDAKIYLHKLIPRKKDKNIEANMPRIKLWYFEIQFSNSEVSWFALWCERGLLESQIEEFENKSEEIHIDQYKFLKSFMSPDVASSLWGEE